MRPTGAIGPDQQWFDFGDVMTGEIISFFGTARSNTSALDNLTLLLWLWNIQRKDQWSILGFDSPEARKPCSGLLRSWICPLISNLTSMTTQVLRHRGTCIIFSHIYGDRLWTLLCWYWAGTRCWNQDRQLPWCSLLFPWCPKGAFSPLKRPKFSDQEAVMSTRYIYNDYSV